MGQVSTNLVKKVISPFYSWGNEPLNESSHGYSKFAVTPFVYRRQGSMYFDEDGDLAHEFYEEVSAGDHCTTMRRNVTNLTPQGYVDLPHPRINADLPIVLVEAPNS